MIRKVKNLSVFTIVLLSMLLIGSHSLTAENVMLIDDRPVAEEMLGSSGITWMPKIGYASLTVTVARPDGSVFTKTFDSGGTPYLDLSEFVGQGFADGLYTYELKANPERNRHIRGAVEMEAQSLLGREDFSQTGYFTVRGGIILNSSSTETLSRPFDQLILDDLIVDGSLCVGFDCINGESFGFDTLRLKENNLRIHFQDTSSSAGFPSNDWRIIINDSNSGGASYFAVEDSDAGRKPFTIEAGAPANSLYVEDGGRVGMGTATPVVELHVSDGDTPTLRLDQDGSGGWAPQVWDVAGNEANFFIRDVTNGSKLPFRIKPGAPTNSIFVASDGKIGLGTDSPAFAMELQMTNTTATFALERTDGATAKISGGSSAAQFGSHSNHDLKLVTGNDTKVTINTSGQMGIGVTPTHLIHLSGGAYSDGTTWQDASSIRFKEDVRLLEAAEAVDTLEGLNPVKFKYKTNKLEEYVGFIAEDVPELVATSGRQGLSPMDIVAVLTKVVKEQQKTISSLNDRIGDLEKKLTSK